MHPATYLAPPFEAVPWRAQSVGWEFASTTETIRAATFAGAPTVPTGWRAWATDMRAKTLNTAAGGSDVALLRLRRNGVLVAGYDDFQAGYQHLSFTDSVTGVGDFVYLNAFVETGNLLPVPIRLEEGDSFSVGFRITSLPVFAVQVHYSIQGWLEPLYVARPGLPGAQSR